MPAKVIANWLVVAMVVGAIIWFAATTGSHTAAEQSSSQETAARSATASPTPPLSIAPVPSSRATNPAAVTRIDAFTERVLAYEEAYRSPETPDRDAQIAMYATTAYIAAHASPPPSTEHGGDVIVRISRDLAATEVVITPDDPTATTRYVNVKATATTVRRDSAGKETVVLGALHLPDHATTWVLDQGVWKVTAER